MTLNTVAALLALAAVEAPRGPSEATRLSGAYRWEAGGIVDILLWEELGPGRLVAFDEEGSVRALTETGGSCWTGWARGFVC